MQRMEWKNGQLVPIDPRPFAVRIILAHLEGITPEEFAKREIKLRGWDGWDEEDEEIEEATCEPSP